MFPMDAPVTHGGGWGSACLEYQAWCGVRMVCEDGRAACMLTYLEVRVEWDPGSSLPFCPTPPRQPREAGRQPLRLIEEAPLLPPPYTYTRHAHMRASTHTHTLCRYHPPCASLCMVPYHTLSACYRYHASLSWMMWHTAPPSPRWAFTRTTYTTPGPMRSKRSAASWADREVTTWQGSGG